MARTNIDQHQRPRRERRGRTTFRDPVWGPSKRLFPCGSSLRAGLCQPLGHHLRLHRRKKLALVSSQWMLPPHRELPVRGHDPGTGGQGGKLSIFRERQVHGLRETLLCRCLLRRHTHAKSPFQTQGALNRSAPRPSGQVQGLKRSFGGNQMPPFDVDGQTACGATFIRKPNTAVSPHEHVPGTNARVSCRSRQILGLRHRHPLFREQDDGQKQIVNKTILARQRIYPSPESGVEPFFS
jgi:hypothetical protein